MSKDCTVYDGIDQVPPGLWEEACGATSSCFTGRDFLRAVETGLPADARVFHAIVSDSAGRPAAGASLCLLPVDLLLLAGPRARRMAGWCRRVLPRLGTLRVLCCGLPVSAGQSQVGFAAGADRERVFARLDTLARSLARRERARVIVFKEFDEAGAAAADVLLRQGYIRADSPPMYDLSRPFADLEAYRAALRSHYRQDVRRSQKKFERAGCRVAHLLDPAEITRAYTPDVHRLYEAVVAKSDVKLELLPVRFFHQLVRHLPGRVSLTTVMRNDRIVAFNWGLADGPEYHFLFCGIDYAENAGADLYFNTMYHQLDLAFRSGARSILFGQTADAFKTRVGCTGSRRYFYARGAGPLLNWVIHRSAGVLGPPRSPLEAHDVFKDPVPAKKAKSRPG